MKIECPECKLAGTVDDSLVPATGIAMNCPRCKARFIVERQQAGADASAMMDSCPSCQYATFSEEKFSVCPKCGLVVADYQRQMLAARGGDRGGKKSRAAQPALTPEQQRRDEESRRKFGVGEPEEKGESGESGSEGVTEMPVPLLAAGWVTIAVAAVLLLYGVSGFMEYLAKLQEAAAAVLAGETAPAGFALFWRFAIIPLLMIGYAASMAVVANRFLALRPWAVRWLEIGGWTGVGLGALTELVEMVAWCSRASANATIGYYATGLLGSALMALLWMFPPFILVEYLRSEQFDRLRDYFS